MVIRIYSQRNACLRSGLRRDSRDGECGCRDGNAEADPESNADPDKEGDSDPDKEGNGHTDADQEADRYTDTDQEGDPEADGNTESDNDSEGNNDTEAGNSKAGDTCPDQDPDDSARCAYAYMGREHEDCHGQGGMGRAGQDEGSLG